MAAKKNTSDQKEADINKMGSAAAAGAKAADNKMVADLPAAEKKATKVSAAAAASVTYHVVASGAHQRGCENEPSLFLRLPIREKFPKTVHKTSTLFTRLHRCPSTQLHRLPIRLLAPPLATSSTAPHPASSTASPLTMTPPPAPSTVPEVSASPARSLDPYAAPTTHGDD